MQLWRYLCQFCKSSQQPQHLFSYIQQAYFDSKKQPTIKSFFGANKTTQASTSGVTTQKQMIEETVIERMEIDFTDDEDDIIESSQNEVFKISPAKAANTENTLPTNHDSIVEIMKIIDGDIETGSVEKDIEGGSRSKNPQHSQSEEKVIIIDEVRGSADVSDKEEESLINASKMARISLTKSKITDYFCKADKPK